MTCTSEGLRTYFRDEGPCAVSSLVQNTHPHGSKGACRSGVRSDPGMGRRTSLKQIVAAGKSRGLHCLNGELCQVWLVASLPGAFVSSFWKPRMVAYRVSKFQHGALELNLGQTARLPSFYPSSSCKYSCLGSQLPPN